MFNNLLLSYQKYNVMKQMKDAKNKLNNNNNYII